MPLLEAGSIAKAESEIKWAEAIRTMFTTFDRDTIYTVIDVNNVVRAGRNDGPGYRF